MARCSDQVGPPTRDVLNLYEQERRLVAYEIHDGLAQLLAGALFKFQIVDRLVNEDFVAAKKACDEGVELVREAMDESRRLIGGLQPPVLEEFGLAAAIQCLISEHRRRDGVEIEFLYGNEPGRQATVVETILYRVTQECLNNACRHSHSDRVYVSLMAKEGHVLLEVRDWGVGFDASQAPAGHYGLRGVRERVGLLGGEVVIETSPGHGTRVSVSLPLVPRENAVV